MKGCVMKKLTTIISVLSLIAGCANTTDSTLEDFWRDTVDEQHSEEGTERLFSQASEVRIVKETPSQKVKTEIIVIDEDDTYQLPTRDERYSEFMPLPEIYAIPAARATNKMLDETRNLYNGNDDVFLFIAAIQKNDKKLPDGIYKAEQVNRKIINGSNTFKVVNDKSEADYILSPSIDNIGSTEEPVIEYRLILTDTENNKINEWVETVKRLNNDDRSWW